MDRTVDGVFDEWSGGVRTWSEGMQTSGNFGKRPDYTGNEGECRGMVRTT